MKSAQYSALKILIIDDFDSFRETLSRMLKEFGCEQVVTVMNAEQALRACNSTQFDVVMCDYNLGSGANGQQILEELRYKKILPRQSLFLLISAEASQSIVLSAYDYAPDAYLTKPITAKSLRQRLERLLRQREEMLPLYDYLDRDDIDSAIELAERAIAEDSRYSALYQRMLGEFYLQQHYIDKAEKLYTQVLEARPLDWARVGLARVKKHQGDLELSNEWLHQILEDNSFCMQAYDVLVENYRQQEDFEKAQQILQSAVEISPLSILRQIELADTAAENSDYPVATKAYGKSVKLGEYSCHDHYRNHLQYGRLTAAWISEGMASTINELTRDGLRVLEQMPRRFELSGDQRLQIQLLECQLYFAQSDEKKAIARLTDIEERIDDSTIGLDVQLDRVATLKALGQADKMNQLLNHLIEQYAEDQASLQRIDLWLEEPVSQKNRKLVATLNNQGIAFYQVNDYARALDSFKRACRLFPQHLGVQLNLLQALVADMKQYGQADEAIQLCASLVNRIESRVQPGSSEMNRLRLLQQALRNLD